VRLSPSRQADHAVRAVVWLAAQPAGSRRKAAEIAAAARIPRPFAARVLARLHRAGLLHARAGQEGGYSLARPVSELTLLTVIEAVEGPLAARRCLLRDAPCGPQSACALHGAWMAAQQAFRAALGDTPLVPPVQPNR
jgi:Rrf2 family protein